MEDESGVPPAKLAPSEKCWAREAGELYPCTVRKRQYFNGWKYFVHYLGWNVRWDKWVGEFDLLEDNKETRKIVQMVKAYKKKNRNKKRQKFEDAVQEGASEASLSADDKKKQQYSQEVEAMERRRAYLQSNNLVEVEDVNPFKAMEPATSDVRTPVMRINLPFSIKRLLVEDWELMKNNQSGGRKVRGREIDGVRRALAAIVVCLLLLLFGT